MATFFIGLFLYIANNLLTQGQGQYLFVEEPWLTWADARDCCQFHGLQLAKIENKQDNDRIYNLVQKVTSNNGYYLWFGASYNTTQGTFTWSDNALVTWYQWGGSEPDVNACVSGQFIPDRMVWNAHMCSTAYSYVCSVTETPNIQLTARPSGCPESIQDYVLSESTVGSDGNRQDTFIDGKFAFPNTTSYLGSRVVSQIEDCMLTCLEFPGCNHVTYYNHFKCHMYSA
ncbi:macrophage mannose receptor 1-like [Haliotis rufescens]|uniref:macrophage mannose receptor 1-like n=1 Tax=Haliotis rufescens TaxID=6454 RepID=UPI00201EFE6F|nr:macrophage mannose receptor 1-like [Haliotis rufescens]